MDETYLKVRGEWVYLHRAVDRDGQTLDFMLSEKRDTKSAKKFFANALCDNGIPKRITIDKSRSNAAGIKEVNKIFKRLQVPVKNRHCQIKLPQQHNRAGSPVHQKTHQADARLQELRLRCSDTCRHRDGQHDPQGPAWAHDKRIPSIRRARWIITTNQSVSFEPSQSLRHSPPQSLNRQSRWHILPMRRLTPW